MCGIIGYVGNKNVSDVLIHGLKSLEYRGYDSAGICVLNSKNKKTTIKSVGKIINLEEKVKIIESYKIGIGHTRWATHGEVNEKNSHPHSSGKVTLVHNGIIENFKEIKEKLKNATFISDTDSEVVAALINNYYKDNAVEAINKTIKEIEGSYALLIMFDNDETLYAVRKGSPLIIGVGNNENFVASDVSAILKYTKKYIDMKEQEIYKITKDEVIGYDINLNIIKNEIKTAEWDLESAQKNNYEHFMLKEINEQPELINKIASKYISNNKIDCIDLTQYKRIDLVACGSAYHAGLVFKNLFDKYSKNINQYITTDVASEYRYKPHFYNDEVLVIVISQSGETADTLASLRMANEHKVDTLAIVNVISSSIAKEAKFIMPMLAGPEIAVATTKGYFTQVLDLTLLLINLFSSQKNIKIEEYLKELTNLNKIVTKTIMNDNYQNIANNIFNKEHIYFIGRGIDYIICLEASLKLKEISYIHSDTYQAGELKHGPIALIEKDTIVFTLITDELLKDKTLSNAIEAKSRGAKLILIIKENIDIDETLFDYIVKIPKTLELIQPLLNIIPFQLIAYYVAKNKKCDIDKPKNLAKSVTVE